jgi:hypothetical protein
MAKETLKQNAPSNGFDSGPSILDVALQYGDQALIDRIIVLGGKPL